MKIFFGVVIGLMILLSSVIAQAANPQIKTITVTIVNDGDTPLDYFGYQPATLPGVPTPAAPLLPTVVEAKSNASFSIHMLPGISYLNYGYKNNFCEVRLNMHDDGKLLVVPGENQPKLICKTVMVPINDRVAIYIPSGPRSEKLQKKLALHQYTVTINNQGDIPLIFLRYRPAELPGAPLPPAPPLSGVQEKFTKSFSFQVLAGDSYLDYGYSRGDFCSFRLHVNQDGHLSATVSNLQGSIKCNTNTSGNTVTITTIGKARFIYIEPHV